jgi:hypothetical protein
MVSYQTWTAVAFDVAQSKGMQNSQENSANLVSLAAEIWQERKAELSTATRAEAERVAEQELNVS